MKKTSMRRNENQVIKIVSMESQILCESKNVSRYVANAVSQQHERKTSESLTIFCEQVWRLTHHEFSILRVFLLKDKWFYKTALLCSRKNSLNAARMFALQDSKDLNFIKNSLAVLWQLKYLRAVLCIKQIQVIQEEIPTLFINVNDHIKICCLRVAHNCIHQRLLST